MKKNILNLLPGVQKNVLLKDFTTYKIGGPAKYFFIAKTKEDLIKALIAAKELKLPFFILGGGSNILVSDKGLKGLVIKMQLQEVKVAGEKVYAEAGLGLTKLSNFVAENSFSGMEWATGIPGTVGGAIYGNAQAFGVKISDFVENVEVLNIKDLKINKLLKRQCNFSLKNSIFKKEKKLIIISVNFKFPVGNKTQITETIRNNLYHRNTKHPMSFPSAGSTFVNPEVVIKNEKLLALYPELINFNKQGTIPAGFMIEKCGLSGRQIGKAKISEKHCNFIINNGGAKAKDILLLIKLAKKKVKKLFKINLEAEVQLVGF